MTLISNCRGIRGISVFLLVGVVFGIVGDCYAQERAIKYVNGVGESIRIFFQPEGTRQFLKPPLLLANAEKRLVSLSPEFKGRRYVVVRTEDQADFHIGWYDLEGVAYSRSPQILIDKAMLYETRTRDLTVWKRSTESIIDRYGRTRTAIRWIPEKETREYSVAIPRIMLKVVGDEGWEELQPMTEGP